MPRAFHPFGANDHAVAQPQRSRHGSDCCGFTPNRVHQGQVGTRQRNRHGKPWESSTCAHINATTWCLWFLQLRQQGPEAIQHLSDPEILALHQTGEVDAAVPVLQQPLQVNQLLQLLWIRSPSQQPPKLRPWRGERR